MNILLLPTRHETTHLITLLPHDSDTVSLAVLLLAPNLPGTTSIATTCPSIVAPRRGPSVPSISVSLIRACDVRIARSNISSLLIAISNQSPKHCNPQTHLLPRHLLVTP